MAAPAAALANNMIFNSTGGDVGRGDVVYSIIHISAQSGVHIANYIRFNMKGEACKIEFTQS